MKYCSLTFRALLLAIILLLHIISVRAQNTLPSIHRIWPVVVEQLPLGDEPTVLISASLQQCVGCAILAINQCITQIHTIRPNTVCVVSIIADDIRDVETIRSRFNTPYVLHIPSDSSFRSASESEVYPAVFVIEKNGGVVLSHYDLQHVTINIGTLQESLNGGRKVLYTINSPFAPVGLDEVEQGVIVPNTGQDVVLQEPNDRSIAHLASIVFQPHTRILYGINTLTNNIERWNIEHGELLEPLVVPDTVRYFFRPSPDDALWSLLERQGYDIMEVGAISAVHDTLYALITLISGYSLQTVVERRGERTDTLQEIDWNKGQVVVKIIDGSVTDVLPLPPRYSFLDLTTDAVKMSGTCIDATQTIESYAAADSLVFLATVDTFSAVQQNTDARNVTVWKQKNSSETSIGQICSDAHGTLWYCDPQQNMLIAQRADGAMQFIEPRGALRRCGSSILIGAKDSHQSRVPVRPYTLQEMVAGTEAVLLLVPARSSSLPCIVQSYSATTGFLGEQKLATGLMADNQSIHLAGIDKSNLVFLLRTTDTRRWKLLRVPVPKSDIVPVSQENSAR